MKAPALMAHLLASTLFCGALAALGTPASAQSTASNDVSTIVVTGTRLPQSANLGSTSPIQTVTSAEFSLAGRTDTSELIYTLPQVSFGSNDLSSTSNPLSGPGGVATVNLRGLGQSRTLVLVDGRRLGIGDPNTGNPNPSPDINQIPTPLIDRVEVLTGGASSTYGSDAIAGVVNFIMKRKFQGVQMNVQWGTYQHSQGNSYIQGLQTARGVPLAKQNVWDGQSRDASVVFGVADASGKASLTVYGVYHDQDPVSYSRRDFANCQLNVTVTATASTGACAGSSNSNIFYSANAAFSGRYAVVGNNFVPYSSATGVVTSPPPLFNSNPYEYLQHGDRRYSAGFFADYEISPQVKLYSDFAYMKDQSTVQIAPAALFQGSGVTANAGFLVNCNNPFLSAQQQGVLGCTAAQIASGATKDLLIGRRNIEGGGRVFDYQHENYRFVLGAKGDIDKNWKYDIYAQRYYTAFNQASQNYISLARIQNSLLVTTNASGQPVCISGGSCVPYNIFQTGGVTKAATDYLAISGSQQGNTTESIASGSITGDLTDYGLKSPFANQGIAIAFGGEYRKDALKFSPDAAYKSGDLSGAGGASVDIDQSLSVKEFFAETRIPLAQERAGIQDLLVEAGYRYSDYSTGISASTYKIGGQYAPVSDIRFRGSYQRAIRAPSILDLYTPQAVTNTSDVSEDPCSGSAATPATATLAQCQRTGVTAAQYGNGGSTNIIPQCPSGQCAVLNGGNVNLSPEKANTYSVGFTLRPTAVPGFIASVDYYSVSVTDELGTIPLAVILNKCLTTGTLCNLVTRAPNGILFGTSVNGGGYISGTTVNVAQQKSTGIDVQVAYKLPLSKFGWDSMGSVNFSLNGSYLLGLKTTPVPGDPTYDCKGLYGPVCDTVNPKWRHTFRATWDTPWNVGLSLGWRYVGPVKLETNSTDPSLTNGRNDTFDAVLKSKNYIDLTATWQANKMFTVRAGVNNVFDVDPPLVSSLISGTGTPNSYPTYDLLGRKIFVAVTANF